MNPVVFPDDTREALRAVTRHLWLGEGSGFALLLLWCPTPRSAEVALLHVRDEVTRLRNAEVHWVVLDPHAAHRDVSKPIPWEVLFTEVLEPLMVPSSKGITPQSVVVVDASRALRQDIDSWRILFRRMNEHRNAIAVRLNAPLLLCLPPYLQFSAEAPDFRSIRSHEVHLPQVGQRVPGARDDASRRRVIPDLPSDARHRQEQHNQLIQARERAKNTPTTSVLIALGKLETAEAHDMLDFARHHRDERRRAEALKSYEGAAKILTEAAEKATELFHAALREGIWEMQARKWVDRTRAWDALSATLREYAEVLQEEGQIDRALEVATELFRLCSTIVEEDKAHRRAEEKEAEKRRRQWLSGDGGKNRRYPLEWPEFQRNKATALVLVGDIRTRQRDLAAAMEAYEAAEKILDQVIREDKDHPEWKRDYILCMERIGDVLFRQGDYEGALESHKKELEQAKKLFTDYPRLEFQRDLSVSLDRAGDAAFELGRYNEALDLYSEGLAVCRDLVEKDGQWDEWQRDLSVALINVASAHEARGDPERALPLYEEAVQTRKGILQRDPTHREHREDLKLAEEALRQLRALLDRTQAKDGAIPMPARSKTLVMPAQVTTPEKKDPPA